MVEGVVNAVSNVPFGRLFDYISPRNKKYLIVFDLFMALLMAVCGVPAALNANAPSSGVVFDFYLVGILYGIAYGACEAHLQALLSIIFADKVEVSLP